MPRSRPPSPPRPLSKRRLRSAAPGRLPALTRVNTIPPGDAKQEAYTARHLKLPRKRANSQTSRASRNGSPCRNFVSNYREIQLLSPSRTLARKPRSRERHLRGYFRALWGAWREAWRKAVGGPLGGSARKDQPLPEQAVSQGLLGSSGSVRT